MTIQIEILNAKPTTAVSPKGKNYTFLDLAYKNLSFQGKVEGKKIMSFGATEAAFKTLATAQSGEVYDVEVVKNGAGYNDFVSAKKSDGTVSAQPAKVSVGVNSTSVTAPPRSTYETPEERAKKQIYIIRQSSLSTATDIVSVGAKKVDVKEVIETAKQLEDYVFGKTSTPTAEAFDDLEDVVL
jgi:hypothetical protein